MREGVTEGRERRRRAISAVALLYASWGLLTWFIFVYGRLLYTLRGAKSEAAYVQSWGIALGMDQGMGFKDVAVEALKAAVVAALLEPYVVPTATWFEEHVDFLSVHASAVTSAAAQAAQTRWGRLASTIKHYAYHV